MKGVKACKGRERAEPDIDDLVALGMAKLAELEEEARAALEEGDRRAYLSTMRVIAVFLRTNAGLLAARQKLKGKERKGLDLASLLSGLKKTISGLLRQRRRRK